MERLALDPGNVKLQPSSCLARELVSGGAMEREMRRCRMKNALRQDVGWEVRKDGWIMELAHVGGCMRTEEDVCAWLGVCAWRNRSQARWVREHMRNGGRRRAGKRGTQACRIQGECMYVTSRARRRGSQVWNARARIMTHGHVATAEIKVLNDREEVEYMRQREGRIRENANARRTIVYLHELALVKDVRVVASRAAASESADRVVACSPPELAVDTNVTAYLPASVPVAQRVEVLSQNAWDRTSVSEGGKGVGDAKWAGKVAAMAEMHMMKASKAARVATSVMGSRASRASTPVEGD
ncbi:hypothetical protein C8R44DRAFT_725043 [Mycena epipterygia]|nr:hypothetical protein C8R44DRAFT_725043 [Mycena epipterygia]